MPAELTTVARQMPRGGLILYRTGKSALGQKLYNGQTGIADQTPQCTARNFPVVRHRKRCLRALFDEDNVASRVGGQLPIRTSQSPAPLAAHSIPEAAASDGNFHLAGFHCEW